MNKLCRRWLLPILLGVPLSASAQVSTWTNAAGGAWSDVSGWDPNALPATTAFFTNGFGSYGVTQDVSATLGTLAMWNNAAGQSVTLTVASGVSLTLTNQTPNNTSSTNGLFMPVNRANLVIDGGTVASKGFFLWNSNLSVLNGGSLVSSNSSVAPRVNSSAGQSAVITIDGGGQLANYNTFDFGLNGNGNAVINLNDGSLRTTGILLAGRGTGTVNVAGGVWTNSGSIFNITARAPSGTDVARGYVNVTGGTVLNFNELNIGAGTSNTSNRGEFNLLSGAYESLGSNQAINVGARATDAFAITGLLSIAGGSFRAASNNTMTIGHPVQATGVGLVTNSGGHFEVSTVNMVRGSLALNGGTNVFSALRATNAAGAVTFSSGLLRVGTATVSNGAAFAVGDGVSAAKLVVDGAAAFADGLAVQPNAALGGAGLITGFTTVSDNGRVAPGDSAGTLTVGPLALSNQSLLDFDLGAPGTTGGGINDLIVVNGDLTLDGTVNVSPLAGFGVGVYTILQYTGALTDNTLLVGPMPAGYTGSIDLSTSNEVRLSVIPEPATAGLIALALLMLTGRSRRRR